MWTTAWNVWWKRTPSLRRYGNCEEYDDLDFAEHSFKNVTASLDEWLYISIEGRVRCNALSLANGIHEVGCLWHKTLIIQR